MSLAADTREAVRERPVLYDALRAGIVNYTAAADTLDVEGDADAIATALRRFARSLSTEADGRADGDAADDVDSDVTDPTDSDADSDGATPTVRMRSGLDRVDVDDLVVAVGGRGLRVADSGGDSDSALASSVSRSTRLTAIDARGPVGPAQLSTVLQRLRIADVPVQAAGVDERAMVVVVPQRTGVSALRIVESTLERF